VIDALVKEGLFGLAKLLVGAYPDWAGCAPLEKQRIYFANHTSHLDTTVICAALPPRLRVRTHPVAAFDYWGESRLRRFIAIKCLNAVLIDRSRHSHQDPLEPLEKVLASGESLIIFPEGTRGSEASPGPFKAGLFKLALRFPDVELVPVYIENLHRAMPKGVLLPVPLICTLRFGFPLAVADSEDKKVFLDRAREAVIELAQPTKDGGR
jgi:1-acyl-sn-glycerol-3-phosphate acyltransferase